MVCVFLSVWVSVCACACVCVCVCVYTCCTCTCTYTMYGCSVNCKLLLTDFSDVHEHCHTHVVNEGWPICKQGIPNLQHTWQGKLPTEEKTNPTTVEKCRKGERDEEETGMISCTETGVSLHSVGLCRDGELLEMNIQHFVCFLQQDVVDHIQLPTYG